MSQRPAIGLYDLGTDAPRRPSRLGLAVAASVVVHLALLTIMFPARREIAPALEPPSVEVSMVGPPVEVPVAPPKAEKAVEPDKPPPKPAFVRPTPRPRTAPQLAAAEEPTESTAPSLSDAELAGAMSAESGPTGRACDMPRLVQAALRKDRLVEAAVAQAPAASHRAFLVWNGDWVRSSGEDGKGLAAVREAILWAVGFAPAPCRSEPMHGLVSLSLNDGSRLVLGAGGEWRWSDLLHPRRILAEE